MRSIAILLILLAHGGFTTFSGGDTALAPFFVISGFLIAQALVRSSGVVSIGEFYDRRARRMLPTLIVATAATLVAGALLLSPVESAALSRAALASVALVSNVAPSGEAGAAPLLHTSSLSTAAQIFLLLPVVVACFGRVGARAVVPLVATATLASFVLGVGLLPGSGLPQMPHALWQFGLGALVAVLPFGPPRRRVAEMLALLGLAAILVPVIAAGPEASRFWTGAVPAGLGSALVIWSNRRETAARALLGSPPMVFLGVISYSLYVWHWPMLVFAQRIWGELGFRGALAWLAATLLVATLSWYFVEQPLRYPTGPIRSRAAVLAASLAGFASVAALAALIAAEGTSAGRTGVSAAFASEIGW
ncbi:acyltransferase family protein [Amaricoccus sp.]|uniref:acyltransferase family protein n=1 Tax=Amaricoccus sp. TaxID=1872485 RepID=UPI0039E65D97